MYALRPKGRAYALREYICTAHTETELEERIDRAFWNWKSCAAKGNSLTKDDYLRDKERVKITVEAI
jgi:hypothetical protein